MFILALLTVFLFIYLLIALLNPGGMTFGLLKTRKLVAASLLVSVIIFFIFINNIPPVTDNSNSTVEVTQASEASSTSKELAAKKQAEEETKAKATADAKAEQQKVEKNNKENSQKAEANNGKGDFGLTPGQFIEEYNKRAKVINKNLVSSSSVPLNENIDHNEFRMEVSKQIISGRVKKDSGKVYDITIPVREHSDDEEKKEFALAMAIVVNILNPELSSKEILELTNNEVLTKKKIAVRGNVSYEFNKFNMFIAKAVVK